MYVTVSKLLLCDISVYVASSHHEEVLVCKTLPDLQSHFKLRGKMARNDRWPNSRLFGNNQQYKIDISAYHLFYLSKVTAIQKF